MSAFEYEIEGRPDFAFLNVQVPAGRTLKVEASAMATMSTNMQMKTKLKGGLGRFLTGESLFVNEFTAEGGKGEIGIAPGPAGDIDHVYLDNQTLFVQNSSFLACDPALDIQTKWQGLFRGFFSGESLFMIKISGTGDLWFNTYGAIMEIDVQDNFLVDTGHIVAFTEGLEYEVEMLGGYKSLFFSGEGLACRFRGTGKVWIQSRKVDPFLNWVYPYRPVETKS